MFWHIYKYRFKSLIRDKESTFWSMLFPIILCTCFVLAFSNLSSGYTFSSIPVTVVYEKENNSFRQTIDSMAADTSQGEAFLKLSETSRVEAEALLNKNKTDAVIIVNDSIDVMVNDSGINQTAIISFVNQYLQTEQLINDISTSNPEKLPEIIANISDASDYIDNAAISDNVTSSVTSYYFSLIGMAALFGCYLGVTCSRQLKADITSEGLRKCISPISRPILLLSEFMVTFTIHLFSMAILLFYMKFVMRINLGNQMEYIFLTCVVGSLFGISLGIFVGSIPKLKESMQIGILTIVSLISSFFSGLMIVDMKMIVQKYAPWFAKLNPATLIQDSLYSLLIYDNHNRYFENMIILTVMTVILCTTSIIMTRRTTYANL